MDMIRYSSYGKDTATVVQTDRLNVAVDISLYILRQQRQSVFRGPDKMNTDAKFVSSPHECSMHWVSEGHVAEGSTAKEFIPSTPSTPTPRRRLQRTYTWEYSTTICL